MNWPIVLQVGLTLVLAFGAAVTVTLILGNVNAEREWRMAACRMPEDRMRVLLLHYPELMEEMPDTEIGSAQLANQLSEVVFLLSQKHEMSEQSARRIVSILRQPSEKGRRLYASKLAREALKARAEGRKQSELVGA